MGRTERPLEPANGVCAEFAAGLRELRRAAGSPPYRQLADRAHYSPTALSEAAAGRRLPTLEVALAYVAACGGDVHEWERRWRAAAESDRAADLKQYADESLSGASDAHPALSVEAADESQHLAPSVAEVVNEQTSARGPWRRVRSHPRATVALLTVSIVAVASVLAAANTGMPGPPAPNGTSAQSAGLRVPAPARPSVTPTLYDAVDPKASGCAGDGLTIATQSVADASGVLGVIELRYSPICRAGWARYTPTAAGTEQVTLSAMRAATGTKTTFEANLDQIAAFTDVLSMTRGCVAAAVTVHLGQRTATATTACSTGAAG